MYLPNIPAIVTLFIFGSCARETRYNLPPLPAEDIHTGEGEDAGYVNWILRYRCAGYNGTPVEGLVPEGQCKEVIGGGMCDGITGRIQLLEGVLPTAEDSNQVKGLDGQLLSDIPQGCLD